MRIRFHDDPDGFTVGAIDVPMPGCPGRMTVAAVGDDKADALHRASLIAERIVNDPIMSALMPPQVHSAIAAAKGLSIAAKRGSRVLRGFLHKLHGPGAQRLAKALHAEAAADEGHDVGDIAGLWSMAKKAARYGTVPGLVYTAAKRMRRKKKRRVPDMHQVNPQPEEPDEQPDEQPDDAQADDSDAGSEE